VAKKFLFQAASPDTIASVLVLMAAGRSYSQDDLYEFLVARGVNPGTRFADCLSRLVDLGLANRDGSQYSLDPEGCVYKHIMSLSRPMYHDLMHYRHYTRAVYIPNCDGYFWTYRFVFDAIRRREKLPSNSDLAAEVLASLQARFPEAKNYGFDKSSISKVLRWVRKMPGEALHNRTVRLRDHLNVAHACLALNTCYRQQAVQYGLPIFLSSEAVDELAGMWLGTPRSMEDAIGKAAQFTDFVQIKRSPRGRIVVLDRGFTEEDARRMGVVV